MSVVIKKSTLDFLIDLKANNNREWFNENKPRYEDEHKSIIAFADELLDEMNKHDHIETPTGKKSLLRIYRDIRFSKDKTPFKVNFSGGFKRATKALRGGYYFHIQPGASFVGGGFWGPNSQDLKIIRDEIAASDNELRNIIADKTFVDTFGTLQGEKVKTAPKGFPKDHEAIDLLRYKQFIVSREFTDEEVLSEDFLQKVNQTFKNMRPFFDFMSEVLTTDSNGESLI